MNRLKLISVLLVATAISACASQTEIRYIQPECAAPPQPSLPTVDAGLLWDNVGQEDYDALMTREKLLVDWAFEMRSMISVLCKRP